VDTPLLRLGIQGLEPKMNNHEISLNYAIGFHHQSISALDMAQEMMTPRDTALDFENTLYNATHECSKMAETCGVNIAVEWFKRELDMFRKNNA
jgi:hypothetical protein